MGSLVSCIEGIGLLIWLKLIRNKMASSYIYALSVLFLAASVPADALKCYKGGPEKAPFIGTVKDSECGDATLCLTKVTNSTKMVEFKCITEADKPSVITAAITTSAPFQCGTTGSGDTAAHECICNTDNCNAPENACMPQAELLKCYQGDTAAKATESKDCPNKCADRCGKQTNKEKVVKTMCLYSAGFPAGNYTDPTGDEKSKCVTESDIEYCVYKEAGKNMPSSSTALESMIFSLIASLLLVKVVIY